MGTLCTIFEASSLSLKLNFEKDRGREGDKEERDSLSYIRSINIELKLGCGES